MQVFQLDGRPSHLEFSNLDRIDEHDLFQEILNVLKKVPDIILGKKEIGPSEDFYECRIGKVIFTLLYDIDDGPSIYCSDSDAMQKLISIFRD